MAHEGQALGSRSISARRQPRLPPHEPNKPVLDHLGEPSPTGGIGEPVSKPLAAPGSAPHAAVVHIDDWAVSLVTRDARLHCKGDSA